MDAVGGLREVRRWVQDARGPVDPPRSGPRGDVRMARSVRRLDRAAGGPLPRRALGPRARGEDQGRHRARPEGVPREPGELAVPGGGRGRLELWEKWRFPLDAVALPSVDGSGWLAIRKVRRRRSFRLSEGRVVERPVSEAELPGCSVELTEFAVGGETWWTLGLRGRAATPTRSSGTCAPPPSRCSGIHRPTASGSISETRCPTRDGSALGASSPPPVTVAVTGEATGGRSPPRRCRAAGSGSAS